MVLQYVVDEVVDDFVWVWSGGPVARSVNRGRAILISRRLSGLASWSESGCVDCCWSWSIEGWASR